ncbi:glycosyltransferase [Motiliproteus sp. SC1-56]|uniref:glycosyltransferase n=1 Tax=Motiliproteus sp. SC1-56 TaxID=2799565 RepID=UPI001A8F16A3|nr:glycosyltransferase [Motiliproteus sp. SC1-56]
MLRAGTARWLFYANLLLVAVLVIYKIYLNFFEQDFVSVHADQVERIEALLEGRDHYRFAVVGNINNSVGLFERQIIPMLNQSGVDFMVSAGNAVSSGGEDKYRALYRTLSHLKIPYLITFGENEHSRLGSFRFYDHFGPYLFSFAAGNSRFIFLDSTGKTDLEWQLRWLEEELLAARRDHLFLFSAHPLRAVNTQGVLNLDDDDLFPAPYRRLFTGLIEKQEVDAVFSANLPLYSRQQQTNTRYVLTGGAGGLLLNNTRSRYHYVEVGVAGDKVSIEPVALERGQHPFWRTLESLWFFIHSLFYVGYLNFILLLSLMLLAALWLRRTLFVERNYYPDFDLDPSPWLDRPLRVAQFTNNYLPFIGGVPISIHRLCRGLRALHHQVLVIAPQYQGNRDESDRVHRVPVLLPFGAKKQFRLANIFSPGIGRAVRRFRPQLVHVHHPFWLGSVGHYLARRLDVPVVYTYHTRLEHYSHYVPLPDPLFRNLLSHLLVRRFANRCDGVVVPTASAEDYLRMIGVKRPIFVRPTGIDFERFQRVDPDHAQRLRDQLELGQARVLITISRLGKEKNLAFMLDALAELSANDVPAYRLLLIGEGPERAQLEARIRHLGLTDRVTLVGAVPPEEIPVYCALGDLFVFASQSETQGMVILEAMAAGMPVVAVRSSGIDDVVSEGQNGFKTPLNRRRWRERVAQLLNDEPLRLELAANGRALAQAHRIEAFGADMSRIYAQVLAAHGRTARRGPDSKD